MPATLLPLFVALPVFAAGISAIFPSLLGRRILLFSAPIATLIGACMLLSTLRGQHTLTVQIGGFIPGVAIPFVADSFSAMMLIATSMVTLVSCWFASVAGEDKRHRFYPALTLVLITGVNGALLTADLFNLFVFIEVMLLPSYALLAMTGTQRRLGAARLFVIVNLLTSSIFLIGVTFVYGIVGTVNLGNLSKLTLQNMSPTLAFALMISIAALCTKAAVFPVYGWLPRTYPATSASIMSLFSGLHTKVAIYAIYRIVASVFHFETRFHWVVIVVLCVTMIVGAYASLGEKTIRSALAFQMVCGVGYILMGLGLALSVTDNPAVRALSLSAGMYYMLHHMVTMAGLILLSGSIETTYGTGRLDRLHGLMRRDPWVAALFAVGSLSLVGFPPMSGAFGKVGLALSAAETGHSEAAVVIATIVIASLGSLLSMIFIWRKVFWGPPQTQYCSVPEAKWLTLPQSRRVTPKLIIPGGLLMFLSIALFIGARPVSDMLGDSADALMNVGRYIQAVLE